MSPIDENLIRHVTETIVERFHPRRIVLFGSHARGDAGPDSDLDLMIEMESDKPMLDRIIDINSAFGLRNWSMDLVVYTPHEVREFRQQFASFVNIIESEGKTLYEQARTAS